MNTLQPDEISRQMLAWLSGKQIASPFGLVFECGADVRRHFEAISHEPEPPSYNTPEDFLNLGVIGGLNAAWTGIPVVYREEMAPDAWTLLYLDGIFLSGHLKDGPIPLEKAFWEARNGQARADAGTGTG